MHCFRLRQPRLKRFVFQLIIISLIVFLIHHAYKNLSEKETLSPPIQLKVDNLSVVKPDHEIDSDKTEFIIKPPIPQPADTENHDQIIVPDKSSGDEDTAKKNAVKELFVHAWSGYKKQAWGANELNAVAGTPHNNPIFGAGNMGATLVDALDTAYIMNLTEFLPDARSWIETNLNFEQYGEVSLFEYNIRFLGGLLSMYSFTKDKLYLEKSKEFADSVLSAFDTPTGLPFSLINLKSKRKRAHSWSLSNCAILAEFGTLQMEFAYLSELTGNPVYLEKVTKIRRVVKSTLKRNNGLFNNFYSSSSGATCGTSISFGGGGDSFYEYLLKEYKRTGGIDEDGLKLYEEAIAGADSLQIYKQSQGGNFYLSSYQGYPESSMEHLTCFMGGLLAYGAKNQEDPNFRKGENLVSTCHLSYAKTAWHLGPDRFSFNGPNLEAVAINSGDSIFIQRPEVVESYFYLWRFTKKQKYRDWAWDVVQALNRTRTPHGFGGVKNVYSKDSALDPVQQSFFLAETLKYLYLIFCDDDVLPFDKWVFNTEAHPLPIYGKVDLGEVWSHSGQ